MKNVIKLILCLFLLASSFGCTTKLENNAKPTGEVVKYVSYDTTDFYTNLDKLESLIETDNVQEELDLYDALYNELVYMEDLASAAYVEYCKDYTNEYYANESVTSDNNVTLASDAFCTVVQKLATSKDAEKFKKHLNNDDLFAEFVEYEELSDELTELYLKETTLVNDYENLDYDLDTYEDEAAGIYYELVSVRNRIAELNDYDNYAEYCDNEIYFRDYTPDQLNEFYKAVKDCNLAEIYDMFYNQMSYRPYYQADASQNLTDLATIIKGMSSVLDESFDFMINNNLIYLTSDENCLNVGYTFLYKQTNTPYIYNSLVDTYDDIYYNVHEFGHFTSAYYCLPLDSLFSAESIELCEIHSTGLELLANDRVMDFFGFKEENCYYSQIISILVYSVLCGCLYDEWQRTIYENKDMTIEEMDELYIKLCREYSLDNYIHDMSLSWTTVNHSYSSPMYYICYALSGFTALEIWLDSLNDFDNAIATYEKIVQTSPFEYTYLDVIEEYDFTEFYDYDKALALLNKVIETCNMAMRKDN